MTVLSTHDASRNPPTAPARARHSTDRKAATIDEWTGGPSDRLTRNPGACSSFEQEHRRDRVEAAGIAAKHQHFSGVEQRRGRVDPGRLERRAGRESAPRRIEEFGGLEAV